MTKKKVFESLIITALVFLSCLNLYIEYTKEHLLQDKSRGKGSLQSTSLPYGALWYKTMRLNDRAGTEQRVINFLRYS